MKLAWTKRAQEDLISIGKFIAEDNIINAKNGLKDYGREQQTLLILQCLDVSFLNLKTMIFAKYF